MHELVDFSSESIAATHGLYYLGKVQDKCQVLHAVRYIAVLNQLHVAVLHPSHNICSPMGLPAASLSCRLSLSSEQLMASLPARLLLLQTLVLYFFTR